MKLIHFIILLAFISVGFSAIAQSSAAPPHPLVGAYYFSGWWRDPPSHFKPSIAIAGVTDWRTQYPDREPLVGWYDDRQEIMDTQIEEAKADGLSFFAFDWYPKRPGQALPGSVENVNNGLHFFINSKNKNKMQFALAYVNAAPFGMDEQEWKTTCDEWVQYFKDPRYVRVAGKPLFIILDASAMQKDLGGPEKAHAALQLLRQKATDAGVGKILIGGGLPWPGPGGGFAKKFAYTGFDFYTAYNYPMARLQPKGNDYGDLISLQPQLWNDFITQSILPYLPVITVGWDRRPILGNNATWFEQRTPAKFRILLQEAREAMTREKKLRMPNGSDGRPVLLVYAWNELGEGGILAPTQKEGDAYLAQIREVFGAQVTH